MPTMHIYLILVSDKARRSIMHVLHLSVMPATAADRKVRSRRHCWNTPLTTMFQVTGLGIAPPTTTANTTTARASSVQPVFLVAFSRP